MLASRIRLLDHRLCVSRVDDGHGESSQLEPVSAIVTSQLHPFFSSSSGATLSSTATPFSGHRILRAYRPLHCIFWFMCMNKWRYTFSVLISGGVQVVVTMIPNGLAGEWDMWDDMRGPCHHGRLYISVHAWKPCSTTRGTTYIVANEPIPTTLCFGRLLCTLLSILSRHFQASFSTAAANLYLLLR
jgi:hypothetical protein